MKNVQIVDSAMLDRLTAQAAESPRLRRNFNFHEADTDACHRLMNAMEPGTYIQPHCHLGEGKDETVTILRGRLGLVEFDADGEIVGTTVMTPGAGTVAVHIPRGVIHTWIALEPGSVFLEAKAGPYRPISEKEVPGWAPPEGSPDAAAYLLKMADLFTV